MAFLFSSCEEVKFQRYPTAIFVIVPLCHEVYAALIDWLGPLLLLVAISFPVALRWGTLPAMLIGGGPWLILIVLAAGLPELLPAHFLTGTQTGFSLAFHLLAAGLGAAALLLLFLRGLTWQRLLVHP